MANPLDSNELIKQQSTRTFYQPGGPGTPAYFFGLDTQYHYISGATIPTNGSIDPIFAPDPRRPGRYKLVGRSIGVPELPTVSLEFNEKWGGIPQQLMAPKCEFNLYEFHGRCGDMSDLYSGWDSYGLIYSGCKFSGNIDLGARTTRDTDDPLNDTAEAMANAIYPVGALSFGEEAASSIVVGAIDAVYGTDVQCADCGNSNDGSKFIYVLTRSNVGSPAAPGQLLYTLDGGSTWTTASITGIGSTAEPRYIGIAGNILFVGTDAVTMHYTLLNSQTGAPTTWSSITQPVAFQDVLVASPRAIYFVNSTTIYRTTSILSPAVAIDTGGTNLFVISGDENTIVAAGNSGEVRYSTNAGQTFITASAPAASNIRALAVDGAGFWLAGTVAGNVYRSTDRGVTWTALSFPGANVGAIADIAIATREVIWIARAASSVAYLVTTLDGGNSWTDNTAGSARIMNWPVFQSISKIAVPTTVDAQVAANYLTVCGLATGGTDGILLTASPTII
jgi:photosystem II stability/assembly factor-like uncharacterized protein